MGSGHVLIVFPSWSRCPASARLQAGERGKEQNKIEHQNKNQHGYAKKTQNQKQTTTTHANQNPTDVEACCFSFVGTSTPGCIETMLAPNAPTGSYNADFSNIYVGSYRFIQAASKIHLLRHEKINKSYAAKPWNTPLCMYMHTNDTQKKKSFSPSLCLTNTSLLPFPQPCLGRCLVGAGEQKSPSHATSSCCGGPRVRVVPEGRRPSGKQRLPGPAAGGQAQGLRTSPWKQDTWAPSASWEQPYSLHSTGPKGRQPTKAVMELSPKS